MQATIFFGALKPNQAKRPDAAIVRCGLALLIALIFSPAATAIGPEPVYGKEVMVVSCHDQASQAGVDIMRSGGNAVDGAVATAFALAVTCPRAGNLGGGGFAVIRTPAGEVITNDHREKAPRAAYRDMFLGEDGKPDPQLSRASHLAVGVPGSVAGLLDMLERYGQLSRQAVMAPAILLAKRGFVLSQSWAGQFRKYREDFARHPYTLALFSRKDGSPYQAGDQFRQPDLAKTLRLISRKGKAGFYGDQTADLFVAEMERGGGLITHEDLERYQTVWRQPVQGSYRGYEIYSMGLPSSGGILLLQMLNALEHLDVKALGFGSAQLAHYNIEVMRRAFANRHLADPGFYDAPVDELISKSFGRKLRADISPNQATPSADVVLGPPPIRIHRESTETTHLSVLGADGWAVSMTTTLNSAYGVKMAAAGTGVMMNNEMDDFVAQPGAANQFGLVGREANSVEPDKRPLSSMTPTLMLKDGKPVLVIGSPGGPTIITAVLQSISNFVDHDMPLDRAIQAPRIHHQWYPDVVFMEPLSLSPDSLSILRSLGHQSFRVRGSGSYNRGIGIVNAIGLDKEGRMIGVADPRRGGRARGY